MKILVTGGAGFIGSNLIERLVQLGHDVVSVDNYSTGLVANHIPGCEYIKSNVMTIEDFFGAQVVFHMAAIARIAPSFQDPQSYIETNTMGTLNVANWCSRNSVPLIFAGTSSKFHGKFKNPYTFSKDVGEDIVTLYTSLFGLKATNATFFNVYGPRQLLTGGYTTLIGRWMNQIENRKECLIYGDGHQRRDFTHVDDIIDALVAIMDQEAYGHEFFLGRGENFSVNEVADMFGFTPKYRPALPGEARVSLNQSQHAQRVLGWKPTKNLPDYIREVKLGVQE